MHEYVANLHVHSVYSDGTGTMDEIALAAKKARVDIIGISDHNTLAGLPDEGYRNGVLMLVGTEIGSEHNHYLAWRIGGVVKEDEKHPQAVIDAVRAQGGLGFIAHPHEKGCKYAYSGRAFTWDDWNVHGMTGLCIWNFTSQWKGPVDSPLKALYYYINRKKAVPQPEPETLREWDRLLSKSRTVAIGGTDAHAFRFGFGPVRPRIFPYKYLFRTINTHVLLAEKLKGDVKADRKLVYNALEKGRCFVALDLLGSARGFEFYAERHPLKATMGEDIYAGAGVKLVVNLPKRAMVKIIRNGSVWREGFGRYHMYTAREPGVYRVEAYRRSLTGRLDGWIFSNPVYVRR